MSMRVTYDETKFKRLKEAYKTAVDNKQDEFVLDGQTYATGYAQYLIEYLTKHLEPRNAST